MIKKEEITLKQIEPAKTGRSKCKSCNNTIEKNTLRVGISYSEQAGGAKWYHLACFPLKDVVASADELEGFTTLNENEQNSVREQMNVTIAPIRCASGDKFIDPPNLEELSDNDKNEISSIKTKIEEIKAVTAEKLREFLTENAQYSAGTKGELLIRAADVIVRGCIPKCSKCEKGFLFWSESTQDYFCKGYTDEETKAVVKCDAVFTKDQINRTPAVISETFWQKKERKRKVTVTTVIEKVDDKKEEQPEEEEPDTGMRKKRKSAGVRKWNNDFIYDKEDSEEQVESVEDEADQEFIPNPNEVIEDNQQIDQDEPEEEEHQQQPPQQSNFFNTVINYSNQAPNNTNTNNQGYYNNDYFPNGN